MTLTDHAVARLKPGDRVWIAWDDMLNGFGVRVLPSGLKSFIVTLRARKDGRTKPNERIVLGRYDRMSAVKARRRALKVLARVSTGDSAAQRGIPLLSQTFEAYIAAASHRKASTNAQYERVFRRHLGDWAPRAMDSFTRQDVEARFTCLTIERGRASANQAIGLMRAVFRRSCREIEGLANPVDLWLASGGSFHRYARQEILSPAELLARWSTGIEATVRNPAMRDVLWFGMYTGMRLNEVLRMRWESVDREACVLRMRRIGDCLSADLPVTRQIATILDRRQSEHGKSGTGWVFPSRRSASGHLVGVKNHYAAIGRAGGAKFQYRGLRHCFVAVAERELTIPHILARRLIGLAPPGNAGRGSVADWTIDQLHETSQRIADRIESLANTACEGAICKFLADLTAIPTGFDRDS